MKLNPDCVRNILLTAENEIGYSQDMRYSAESDYKLLNQYSSDEVFYHIDQCEMSGLIVNVSRTMDRVYYIRDISPSGHEFLANIRSDNIWNKTKDIAKKVGSISLHSLTKIAISVVASLIKDQF